MKVLSLPGVSTAVPVLGPDVHVTIACARGQKKGVAPVCRSRRVMDVQQETGSNKENFGARQRKRRSTGELRGTPCGDKENAVRELAAPGSPYSGKGNKAVLLEKLRRLRVVKNGGPSPQRIRGAQHARQEISPAKRSRRGSTVERLGDCRMALWWQGRRAETIQT